MSDVFYLRPISPAAAVEDVFAMAAQAGGCFNLHRVDWNRSFLAQDGGRMLCWYQAPDSESVRNALRQLGSDMKKVWTAQETGMDLRMDELNLVIELQDPDLAVPLEGVGPSRSMIEISSINGQQRLILLNSEICSNNI